MSSLHRTASWIIVDKESRVGVYETFNEELIAKINRDLYDAVPVLAYLQDLNRRIAQAGGVQPS